MVNRAAAALDRIEGNAIGLEDRLREGGPTPSGLAGANVAVLQVGDAADRGLARDGDLEQRLQFTFGTGF